MRLLIHLEHIVLPLYYLLPLLGWLLLDLLPVVEFNLLLHLSHV